MEKAYIRSVLDGDTPETLIQNHKAFFESLIGSDPCFSYTDCKDDEPTHRLLPLYEEFYSLNESAKKIESNQMVY